VNGYTLSPAARYQLIFWSGAIALFIAFLWLFSGVLLPFVLGISIAYLLDPVVTRITRWKLPRWAAALIILAAFVAFVAAAAAVILPAIYREMTQLAAALPGYAEKLWVMLSPYTAWAQEKLGNTDVEGIKQTLQAQIGKMFAVGGSVLSGIATGGQAVAGFLTTMVLTPVVAYYMMKEWPAMKTWFNGLLPRKHYDTIQELLVRIDGKIAGFVRGQITVAFLLAVIYAVALSLAGLNYGFLIGFMAGVLSIIPMVGSAVGLVVAVAVAWFQAGSMTYVAIIAAIFLVGQFVEGNFLTPKFLGDSVGLHPLWIMFALLAGGAMLGIVGMLVAVPAVAVVGVLASFAIEIYKNSAYYNEPAKKKKK
jgi:predicted PurR-regulated permease PerM